MLIPGVPAAGAQQEVFRPDRQPRTTAAEGPAHDPLAELPVERQAQHGSRQRGGQGRETVTAGSDTEHEVDGSESAAREGPDLPRKGLLVDIRA